MIIAWLFCKLLIFNHKITKNEITNFYKDFLNPNSRI